MAEEPENLTLALLREMRAEMREGFAEMRQRLDGIEGRLGRIEAEQERFASLLGKVADAVTAIAELQQNHGARLNAIEGRLAIIEKNTGLVKA